MLKISPDLNVALVTDPRARRLPLVTTLTPRHSATQLFVKSLRIIFMMSRDLMMKMSLDKEIIIFPTARSQSAY